MTPDNLSAMRVTNTNTNANILDTENSVMTKADDATTNDNDNKPYVATFKRGRNSTPTPLVDTKNIK